MSTHGLAEWFTLALIFVIPALFFWLDYRSKKRFKNFH
jgi:hypothetical protein